MKNTPHINQTAEIAETILLPGDPLRAKFISENFLENVQQFNKVRNALGYTGTYKGKKISVMGTGMGIPSMAIYSYELINTFGVKNLIRIGSCGAIQEDIKVYDTIICMGASTNSNFSYQFDLTGTFSATANWGLLQKAVQTADKLNINVHVGNVLSSDVFYSDIPKEKENGAWAKMGILGVEMETYGLYATASRYNANSLAIFTVSDHLITNEVTTAEEREKSLTNMINIALNM